MLFRPLLGTDLSGSVGGITASHNRGGAYFRNRAIPVNPNTVQQQLVRGILATLTSRWNDNLTAIQRAAWDLYAVNVPLTGPLGESRNVGGLPMYIRSNVPRIQVALPRVDDAPIIFNLGDFTTPTFDTLVAGVDTYNVNFTIGDAWVSEDDAAMLLFSSRPQNATINFFNGPYRFDAPILGDLGAPPASPVVTAASFPFGVGNRVFFKASVTRADGRLSSSFRSFGTGA